jgi:hypothetical protein
MRKGWTSKKSLVTALKFLTKRNKQCRAPAHIAKLLAEKTTESINTLS